MCVVFIHHCQKKWGTKGEGVELERGAGAAVNRGPIRGKTNNNKEKNIWRHTKEEGQKEEGARRSGGKRREPLSI